MTRGTEGYHINEDNLSFSAEVTNPELQIFEDNESLHTKETGLSFPNKPGLGGVGSSRVEQQGSEDVDNDDNQQNDFLPGSFSAPLFDQGQDVRQNDSADNGSLTFYESALDDSRNINELPLDQDSTRNQHITFNGNGNFVNRPVLGKRDREDETGRHKTDCNNPQAKRRALETLPLSSVLEVEHEIQAGMLQATASDGRPSNRLWSQELPITTNDSNISDEEYYTDTQDTFFRSSTQANKGNSSQSSIDTLQTNVQDFLERDLRPHSQMITRQTSSGKPGIAAECFKAGVKPHQRQVTCLRSNDKWQTTLFGVLSDKGAEDSANQGQQTVMTGIAGALAPRPPNQRNVPLQKISNSKPTSHLGKRLREDNRVRKICDRQPPVFKKPFLPSRRPALVCETHLYIQTSMGVVWNTSSATLQLWKV